MFADNHPEDWDDILDAMAEEADRQRDEPPFADCCSRPTVHWHIPPATSTPDPLARVDSLIAKMKEDIASLEQDLDNYRQKK